jgi:hypothetical protein
MTIVVWDGETLAADRAATDGAAQWEIDKIWWSLSPTNEEVLLSGAGPLQTILEMREWYKNGTKRSDFPQAQQEPSTWCHFILVDKEGLTRWEQGPHRIVHGTMKCAFGEGRDFAYGAMEMGANAERAVEVANKFSVHCGLGVITHKLGEQQ